MTADLLRRAADQIERHAANATPHPWRTHDTHLDHGGHTATVLAGPDDLSHIDLVGWMPTFNHQPWDQSSKAWADARWIAMLGPQVAAPLAAWLRESASHIADSLPGWSRKFPDAWEGDTPRPAGEPRSDEEVAKIVEHHHGRALAVAKVILGMPT